MLSVLKIKNLALVDDITWDLSSGLIGVTGQTGAGKSMIVGALKLILGERANHDMIRRGESTCAIEASFELSHNLAKINRLLAECGLEPCEANTLVVKRTFGSGNSQFINCSPCTLSVLKRLGNSLVDLHGPHEHQSLLSCDRQLTMLDAFAQAEEEAKVYRFAYRNWARVAKELEEFRGIGKATNQEIDLLRYQLDEIETAGLDESEVVELERRYSQARNSSRLMDASHESLSALHSAVKSLDDAKKSLTELQRMDTESTRMIGDFESARLEIEELEKSLRVYVEDLEIDPTELNAMENRIDQVENLKRKYGPTITEVITYGEEVKTRLSKIENREEEMVRMDAVLAESRAQVDLAAKTLSTKRRKAAPILEREIIEQLGGLGFRQSIFQIEISDHETPCESGLESIDFLFGPNPGESIKPLRIVASSGEMSRVMLAIKSALADQDDTALMVFDEIDANVGGEIAGAVGKKMATLAERHQVIAITHMPQVAARASRHYLVTKKVSGDSTHSEIRRVGENHRVEELARMLGGIGAESLALASRLLTC